MLSRSLGNVCSFCLSISRNTRAAAVGYRLWFLFVLRKFGAEFISKANNPNPEGGEQMTATRRSNRGRDPSASAAGAAWRTDDEDVSAFM